MASGDPVALPIVLKITKTGRRTDMALVVEYEWVYRRGRQQIVVQRWRRPDKVWELTVIWPTGETETEGYVDRTALSTQHARLERQLAKAGWALIEFRPERRRRQRRQAARPLSASTDRRQLGRVVALMKRR